MTLDFADSALRLVVAVLLGMALGLNRDLHGKPTGIRTLGLVSLGAAITTLGCLNAAHIVFSPEGPARVLQGVVQGVLTGIGFLGGGVILRSTSDARLHNITTAATVWVTAALGIACAVADWRILGIGFALVAALLIFGKRLERHAEKIFGRGAPAEDED